MASRKQIAANRRNAEQSTGPRTLAGKNRSRLNSAKHLLSSSSLEVMREYHPHLADEIEAALIYEMGPSDPAEDRLFNRVMEAVLQSLMGDIATAGLFQAAAQLAGAPQGGRQATDRDPAYLRSLASGFASMLTHDSGNFLRTLDTINRFTNAADKRIAQRVADYYAYRESKPDVVDEMDVEGHDDEPEEDEYEMIRRDLQLHPKMKDAAIMRRKELLAEREEETTS